MVRKQVYIEERQDLALARRARQLKLTESTIIRRGLDLVTRHPDTGAVDQAAWRSELAFIRRRAASGPRPAKRAWTRDEIYEERVSRRH
jgi:hypothetical protein